MGKGSGGGETLREGRKRPGVSAKVFPDFSQYPEEKKIERKGREVMFQAPGCYKTEAPTQCVPGQGFGEGQAHSLTYSAIISPPP